MHKIVALVLTMVALHSAQIGLAQEKSYLLNDSTKLGGYIGPGYQMTAIGGQYSGQFMLKGGFVLDQKFAVGAFFAEMMNELNPSQIPADLVVNSIADVDLSYNEVGLDFFYSPNHDQTVHITYGVSASWGKLQLKGNNTNLGEASVASVIPQLNVGVNLLPWIKLQAGFGYRLASELNGFDDYGLGSRDLNAPNAQFGIYLGRY